jgi:hypothetical protein
MTNIIYIRFISEDYNTGIIKKWSGKWINSSKENTVDKKSPKKGLFDFGMEIVRDLMGGKTKEPTLGAIKLADLEKMKIRLNNKESGYLDEYKMLEQQKRDLFTRAVKEAGGNLEEKVIARQIISFDKRAKNLDKMIYRISKQINATEALIRIKEIDEMNKELGKISAWGEMDISELMEMADKAMVDDQFNQEKLDELMSRLDQTSAYGYKSVEEDKEIDEIVTQIQKAREIAHDPEKIDEFYEDLSKPSETSNINFEDEDFSE